jgi:hypothetical protein
VTVPTEIVAQRFDFMYNEIVLVVSNRLQK